jgi:hypothetical protein
MLVMVMVQGPCENPHDALRAVAVGKQNMGKVGSPDFSPGEDVKNSPPPTITKHQIKNSQYQYQKPTKNQ